MNIQIGAERAGFCDSACQNDTRPAPLAFNSRCQQTLQSVRVVTSAWVKSKPALFLPLAWMRKNHHKCTRVRTDTDLVIEGYWRCGNHYAVYAFQQSQPRPVQIAHHFHSPAQLILAVRWGVPALLLIREPLEAVASATAYLQRHDPLPLLHFYNIFHAPLLPYRDRIVISDFPRTTGDFGSVIAEINRRFGRRFSLYQGRPNERRQIEDAIRQEHQTNMGCDPATLPLPSEEKQQRKQLIIESLRLPRYRPLLLRAQKLYQTLRPK